jgi:long-chain acyl-CoA synthetase
MRGYYRNPERTGSVLVDRWFNSGDLGLIDAKGYIRITGRAKDTIVLASGENVEPEHVEAAIKMSPLIEQAVVVGQDRKGLGALLVVATDALEQRVPRDRWQIDGAFVTSEEVHKLIRKELNSLLTREKGFRPSERISAFRVMHEPMTADNGCMTATLKVKRHIVHGRYNDAIDEMFVP